jgi:hypothetical protein
MAVIAIALLGQGARPRLKRRDANLVAIAGGVDLPLIAHSLQSP